MKLPRATKRNQPQSQIKGKSAPQQCHVLISCLKQPNHTDEIFVKLKCFANFMSCLVNPNHEAKAELNCLAALLLASEVIDYSPKLTTMLQVSSDKRMPTTPYACTSLPTLPSVCAPPNRCTSSTLFPPGDRVDPPWLLPYSRIRLLAFVSACRTFIVAATFSRIKGKDNEGCDYSSV